jgi:flagellar protein FlbD
MPSLFPFFCDMIKVTRLDGVEYYVNPHQIECIEINPDTTLVMLSGKHYIVREEADNVLGRINAYRRRLSPMVVQE